MSKVECWSVMLHFIRKSRKKNTTTLLQAHLEYYFIAIVLGVGEPLYSRLTTCVTTVSLDMMSQACRCMGYIIIILLVKRARFHP